MRVAEGHGRDKRVANTPHSELGLLTGWEECRQDNDSEAQFSEHIEIGW